MQGRKTAQSAAGVDIEAQGEPRDFLVIPGEHGTKVKIRENDPQLRIDKQMQDGKG